MKIEEGCSISRITIPTIEVDDEMDREIDAYLNSKETDRDTKEYWYEEPANFPVRLIRDNEHCATYRWVYKREDFIKAHKQGFRLVTEEERDKLSRQDDCNLIRSLFKDKQ